MRIRIENELSRLFPIQSQMMHTKIGIDIG